MYSPCPCEGISMLQKLHYVKNNIQFYFFFTEYTKPSKNNSGGCCHSNKDKKKLKKTKKTKKSKFNYSSSSSSSSSEKSSDGSEDSGEDTDDTLSGAMKELEKKKRHPHRLHSELWYNEKGEMNDGPLCRCSLKAQRSGIRHGYYVGEQHVIPCNPWSNNINKLYHYFITMSPSTNFLTKIPTAINFDSHEFLFEGFSLFSHRPLDEVPACKVIRFNIEYTLLYFPQPPPENFCIHELNLFSDYLFHEILELIDLDLKAVEDPNGCPIFHFLPRFVRALPENGKEVLSMNEVLKYLLASNSYLIDPEQLPTLLGMPQFMWQDYADNVKGMLTISSIFPKRVIGGFQA